MFQLAVSCPLLSGYDEPKTLSYQITLFGPIGADVRQKKYDRWHVDFFALLAGFDTDTYELTNVGNTRAMAIAKVTKDKILGNLNIENIDSHLLACGVSYEAMSLAVVEHS